MNPEVEKKVKTASKSDIERLNILADMLELQVVDDDAPKIGEVQFVKSAWTYNELNIIKGKILKIVQSL